MAVAGAVQRSWPGRNHLAIIGVKSRQVSMLLFSVISGSQPWPLLHSSVRESKLLNDTHVTNPNMSPSSIVVQYMLQLISKLLQPSVNRRSINGPRWKDLHVNHCPGLTLSCLQLLLLLDGQWHKINSTKTPPQETVASVYIFGCSNRANGEEHCRNGISKIQRARDLASTF